MKFRAKIDDSETMFKFSHLVNLVAKLTPLVILRLTERKIFMIEPTTSSSDAMLWCEVLASSFFNNYIMEGVEADGIPDREIILEVSTVDFMRALKIDGKKMTPTLLKLKLSRQNISDLQRPNNSINNTTLSDSQQPTLVIQHHLRQNSSGKDLEVTRELKVEVVARKFWKEYIDPQLPNFDVSMFLPSLHKVKIIVDKLKNVDKYIIIRATNDGTLQIRSKSSTLKTTIDFPTCEQPEWDNTSQFKTQSEKEEASCRVPVKRILDFCSGDSLKPSRCILNILDCQFVHCYLLLGVDVNLQFLIPHVQHV
jgi:HUS1 checkpoint protein